MPDLMDHVQDRVQRDLDVAIAVAQKRRAGLPECEICDEPISTLRQSLGARLCVAHQEDAERQANRAGRR